MLADDIGIGLDVCGTRRALHQSTQCGETAHVFQQLVLPQPLRERYRIERTVAVGQFGDGAEYQAVIAAVEIILDDMVCHPVPSGVVEHQSAQYGLLRLQRMRRHFQDIGIGAYYVSGT